MVVPFVFVFLNLYLLIAIACGVLVPRPGMEPVSPTVETQSLNRGHKVAPLLKAVSLIRAALVAQMVKNLPAVQETWV